MSQLSPDTQHLSDVFKTVGQPTVTYVERESGALEQQLSGALNERGQLCLICGPSKTGKTTLYREVLRRRNEEPLIVRCDRSMTTEGVWLNALEQVDFERVENRTTTSKVAGNLEAEVSGKLSWAWLAESCARLKGSFTIGRDEAQQRKRVLGAPGPDLLVPILSHTSYRLVIEDFHYLPDAEKVLLFQQWKRFTDNEVSVIVLGTTHRAVEIASSNKDLVGRVSQINVGNWGRGDLSKIVEKGFTYLKLPAERSQVRLIAHEAVGLPIIVQQICLTLVAKGGKQFTHDVMHTDFNIDELSIRKAMHDVAHARYKQFEDHYDVLVQGPREKARKYKTYEIVLACFALDPIQFSLKKNELIARMGRMNLRPEDMPPVPSVNSTLAALSKFQRSRNLDLLEWQASKLTLHMLEPSFLFFVRWREFRQPDPKSGVDLGASLKDILESFLKLVPKSKDKQE